jgi:hypothetical protein
LGEWQEAPGDYSTSPAGQRAGKTRRYGWEESKRERTGNVVDAVINNDVKALLAVVLGDISRGEFLRHFERMCETL